MSDPVGWVVAARTPGGAWALDSIGMWGSREEAEEDRADAQRKSDRRGDGDTYVVCAVVPAEEGER